MTIPILATQLPIAPSLPIDSCPSSPSGRLLTSCKFLSTTSCLSSGATPSSVTSLRRGWRCLREWFSIFYTSRPEEMPTGVSEFVDESCSSHESCWAAPLFISCSRCPKLHLVNLENNHPSSEKDAPLPAESYYLKNDHLWRIWM